LKFLDETAVGGSQEALGRAASCTHNHPSPATAAPELFSLCQPQQSTSVAAGAAAQGAEPAVPWTTQLSLPQAIPTLLHPSASGFLLVQSH